MSDNNSFKNELVEILSTERLSTAFQPIFDVSNKSILGYEALTRGPSDSALVSPITLFDSAYQYGLLSELERLCRKLAIKRFSEQALSGKLFLNISPLVLAQPNHPKGETTELLAQYGLSPKRVVIEVTEVFDGGDTELLKRSLEYYRQLGFKIAIDDLGTGHSGLKQWAELRPDIVKIDKYFVRDCHSNVVKRELLRTIFQLGKSTGVKIIAEGIEKAEEFLLLKKIGMELAQGFLLGSPKKIPETIIPRIIQLKEVPNVIQPPIEPNEINTLINNIPALKLHEKCVDVYKCFEREANVMALAVVDNQNTPIGMVYRQKLAELFSGEFGHALYDKKPITTIMEDLPFVVDINTSLVDLSDLITRDESLALPTEFVVVDNHHYAGLANVRVLLKRMTEEKIKHAQHANPLTLLPGNVVIEQEISQLLALKSAFTLAYFDLNHFKPFNDLYGYATGDNVIKLVADILSTICKSNHTFVGHIGGDDFVVIFMDEAWQPLCKSILTEFEQRLMQYFKAEHIESKGYWAINRNGEKQFFPLLSISCGIVQPHVDLCRSHLDVAAIANDAKKSAKTLPGNSMYICSKKHPEDYFQTAIA